MGAGVGAGLGHHVYFQSTHHAYQLLVPHLKCRSAAFTLFPPEAASDIADLILDLPNPAAVTVTVVAPMLASR